MPETSLLLPSQPTPLATLVAAAVAAVSIMAGSLIVLADAPAPAAAPSRALAASNAALAGACAVAHDADRACH